jgi:DNA transformation protein
MYLKNSAVKPVSVSSVLASFKPVMNNIRDLTGLGVKSEAMLKCIGIDTVDEFLSSDVFELYQQLSKVMPSNLNMLYAMIGAQENLPWQEIAQTRKIEILMRLDDIGLAPK